RREYAGVRGDHRGSEDVYAAVEDLDAVVPPPRARGAVTRVQVRGIRRRNDVRPSAKEGDAMTRRRVGVAWGAALLFGTVVMAQSGQTGYKVPRTAWGDPDFQGIWTNIAEGSTPLERPVAMGTRAVLNDAEWQARFAAAKKQAGEMGLRGVDIDVPSRQ